MIVVGNLLEAEDFDSQIGGSDETLLRRRGLSRVLVESDARRTSAADCGSVERAAGV